MDAMLLSSSEPSRRGDLLGVDSAVPWLAFIMSWHTREERCMGADAGGWRRWRDSWSSNVQSRSDDIWAASETWVSDIPQSDAVTSDASASDDVASREDFPMETSWLPPSRLAEPRLWGLRNHVDRFFICRVCRRCIRSLRRVKLVDRYMCSEPRFGVLVSQPWNQTQYIYNIHPVIDTANTPCFQYITIRNLAGKDVWVLNLPMHSYWLFLTYIQSIAISTVAIPSKPVGVFAHVNYSFKYQKIMVAVKMFHNNFSFTPKIYLRKADPLLYLIDLGSRQRRDMCQLFMRVVARVAVLHSCLQGLRWWRWARIQTDGQAGGLWLLGVTSLPYWRAVEFLLCDC